MCISTLLVHICSIQKYQAGKIVSTLTNYINGLSSGNEFYTTQKNLRIIVRCLSIYHIVLALAFIFNDIMALAVYNTIVAILYFTVIAKLTDRNRCSIALTLSICEVVLCTLISTLFTGMDTGFAIYNVGCITGFFYVNFIIQQKHSLVSLFTSLILSLCYMFNYLISLYVEPIAPIKSIVWVRTFYICNHMITFAMIVVFTFLIVWEIRSYANKLKEHNNLLNEAALKDPLTHLYNRRSMNEILNTSMSVLKSKGKRFSIILGDIDNFKQINDTYGHDAGDEILIAVANTISECVGTQGAVCRWGGEEILILINASIETASVIAERTRAAIEETVVTTDGQKLSVTMTMGITESIPGYKIENLIQQADDKMYYGKKNGKNQVVISLPNDI